MNIKKPKLSVTTLSVVSVLALGMVVSGCGTPAEGGGNTGNQDAAREQFLAERSGTPDPNATPLPGAGGGNRMMGGMMPGMF